MAKGQMMKNKNRDNRPDHELEDHDRGLRFDLETMNRRRLMGVLGAGVIGIGVVGALSGCSSEGDKSAATGSGADSSAGSSTSTSAGASATATSGDGECETIPEETAGPYPGDGSNGPDVLAIDGVVREDIRSSFGTASGTAEGVPLRIEFDLVDAENCAPVAGAALYAWHCDREGRYSMYSSGVQDENYLRGVQVSDEDGHLSFTSIYPGCYSGRWPHIHFEIYDDVSAATGDGTRRATSQVALTEDSAKAVYAEAGYEASVRNLSQITLATDNVFGDDGGQRQLGTVTGSVEEGFTVHLQVVVDRTRESTGGDGGGMGGPGGAAPGGRGPGGGPGFGEDPPQGDASSSS